MEIYIYIEKMNRDPRRSVDILIESKYNINDSLKRVAI